MKSNKPNGFAIVASLSIVVFLLGLLGVLIINATKVNSYVKENMKITVFFDVGIENAKTSNLADSLASLAYVIDSKYISSDDAAFTFKNEIGEDFIDVLGENPLPASVELAIKPEFTKETDLSKIEHSLSKVDLVLEASYPKNVFEQLNRNRKMLSIWLGGLSAVMIIVAIVLMVSTIQLLIYGDRFLIKNQQLIGATEEFILKPYNRKAIKWTVTSFIIGVVMLLFILWLAWTFVNISMELNSNIITDHLKQSWYQYILMLFLLLIGGVAVVYSTTKFAAKKYLNTHTDNLYK
jgi:cell division transport system permease protein